jgi:hypothetical protein
MDRVTMPFLLHLIYRIPILIVCLLGFVLAIAFWKRCPRACLLTLLATGLELLATPLVAFLQMYLVQSGKAMPWMSTVGLAGTFFHMVSTALLIIAVFIGRPRASMTQQSLESIQNQYPGT